MIFNFSLLNLIYSLALAPLQFVRSQDPPEIQCIDALSQFDNWISTPKDYGYAKKSEELPDPLLKDKLKGHGIFYLTGEDELYNQAFHTFGSKPDYIYIKYYALVKNPEISKVYVYPVKTEYKLQFLDSSSDFIWDEILLEIDADWAETTVLELGGAFLQTGDYLFVDRIALAYRAPFSMDVITNFCWTSQRQQFSKQIDIPLNNSHLEQ